MELPAYEEAIHIHIAMVSCQKGPTRHAYAWQIGPFWQDTLDIYMYIHIMFADIEAMVIAAVSVSALIVDCACVCTVNWVIIDKDSY